jgi:hypothetical protein
MDCALATPSGTEPIDRLKLFEEPNPEKLMMKLVLGGASCPLPFLYQGWSEYTPTWVRQLLAT